MYFEIFTDDIKFFAAFTGDAIALIPRILQYYFSLFLYKLKSLGKPAQPSSVRLGKPCPYADIYDVHPFIAPQKGDSRSPCPALNALANHGYINRDGNNLDASDLIHGLMACYNLSFPLASFLSRGGVTILGKAGRISLRDLALHDHVEHDASIAHANAGSSEYAPSHSDPELFSAFLGDARNEAFTHVDIARARVRREKQKGTQVTALQQEVARGEVALVLQVFGGASFTVPVNFVQSWWGAEQLPEGWRPTRQTTLLGTVFWSSMIRWSMSKLRRQEAAPTTLQDAKVEKTFPEKFTAKVDPVGDSDVEMVEKHVYSATPPTSNIMPELSDEGDSYLHRYKNPYTPAWPTQVPVAA